MAYLDTYFAVETTVREDHLGSMNLRQVHPDSNEEKRREDEGWEQFFELIIHRP